MSVSGYVSLHRRMLSWEWYNDANVLRLFIHLLLKASYKPWSWRGIEVAEGQLVTSINILSRELLLSRQEIRTALRKLISTRSLTRSKVQKYILISITYYKFYQAYQPKEQPLFNHIATRLRNNNQHDDQPHPHTENCDGFMFKINDIDNFIEKSETTINHIINTDTTTPATDIYNNIINNNNNNLINNNLSLDRKKSKNGEYHDGLSLLEFSAEIVAEIVRIRKLNSKSTKAKKITQNIANALNREIHEALAHGYDMEYILSEWEYSGWQSFRCEWFLNRIGHWQKSQKQTKNFDKIKSSDSLTKNRTISQQLNDMNWAE